MYLQLVIIFELIDYFADCFDDTEVVAVADLVVGVVEKYSEVEAEVEVELAVELLQ